MLYTFGKEMIHIMIILVHDTTDLCALEMQSFLAFSVILVTARLRKQFVLYHFLMGHHVAAPGFVLRSLILDPAIKLHNVTILVVSDVNKQFY